MGLLWSLSLSIQFFIFHSLLYSSMLTNSLPFVQPTHECHEDESNALLHFKESFVITKSASLNPSSYPKTASWMPSTDCCSWHGIQCDDLSGHVIGIDLSSSHLYGPMDVNSTLFSLVHLQSLDLSDNDFNSSQIPARTGEFSQLRYLNLSHISETTFSGEVPPQVSHLSNLLFLDLRSYVNVPIISDDHVNHLRLNISTLRNLIQNSTKLEVLRLDFVTISSYVPDILTNLTSLQILSLYNCELYGEFPIGIFHLPNLRSLNLGNNQNLNGMLPDFHSSALMSMLNLQDTSFHGTLPPSIGNLSSLNWLSISQCNFYGPIPSSLGNLNQLEYLDLSSNSLQGQLELDMFLKLQMLAFLYLSYNNLSLFFVKSSSNVTFPPIQVLGLDSCNLSGEIPSWIMNLTSLKFLSLQKNKLHGEIPHSLFKLENLALLSLTGNFLEGHIEFGMFLKFKVLTYLTLSRNKLSLFDGKGSFNATLPALEVLDLDSCNLVEFPTFLQDLNELISLDMSNNKLKSLPIWIWEKTSLQYLYISNSSLTREISPSICNLKSLVLLDLAYNNLSGTIPSCLGSFSQSLQILKLQGNKLFGSIPETYMIGSSLKMIDFSDNNLQGPLPRALVNCKMLEFFDVSHNQINDSFPFWLSTLPELKVVVLRHNKFYGDIMCPRICTFSKLHIIDLSYNDFSGNLAPELIKNWKSMAASNTSQLQYEDNTILIKGKLWYPSSYYSLTMSNKGVVMNYEKLQQVYFMMAIDISSNKISGEIPKVIGDLKGLVLLNLSNNMLTGNIPSSLGKLSNLEALDLSHNSLSGKIPPQLIELTFLEFFNVSFNNLSGPTPENRQFATFQGNSFEGNQGLCGIQLLKKCEDHVRPLPPTSDGGQDSDSGSFFEFGWKIIVIGYGGGLVAGLALGSAFSLDFLEFLKRIFLSLKSRL